MRGPLIAYSERFHDDRLKMPSASVGLGGRGAQTLRLRRGEMGDLYGPYGLAMIPHVYRYNSNDTGISSCGCRDTIEPARR